jgi:chitinase
MITKSILESGSRIILAFASFNFDSADYIPGFGNISIDEVLQITNLAHSHGLNISLSVGGATYPFAGSDLYSRPGDLASNINQIVVKCGFDGVDFDIEDSYSNVP